jgi:hypothetical protein
MKFNEQNLPQSDTELATALLRFKGEPTMFSSLSEPTSSYWKVTNPKQENDRMRSIGNEEVKSLADSIDLFKRQPMFSSQLETRQLDSCEAIKSSAAFEVTGGTIAVVNHVKKQRQDSSTHGESSSHLKEKIDNAINCTMPAIQPIRKHNFVAFEIFNEVSPANVSSNESLTDDNDSIRREKINAALQSMPQRGRKRDNLSEHERMELTRTRNREHAKSTRIRKKARYQELLDKERILEKLEEESLLNENKRRRALNFAQARLGILQRNLDKSGHLNEKCLVQHVQVESEDFDFYSSYVNTNKNINNHSGREAVRKFDEWLADRVLGCFASNDQDQVVDKVLSSHSVALTEKGNAIIQTELRLSSISNSSTNPVGLAIMWIHLTFHPNSEKLQQVEISFAEESFEKQNSQSLVSQNSHPSVVSLDPFLQDVIQKLTSKHETECTNDQEGKEKERNGDVAMTF